MNALQDPASVDRCSGRNRLEQATGWLALVLTMTMAGGCRLGSDPFGGPGEDPSDGAGGAAGGVEEGGAGEGGSGQAGGGGEAAAGPMVTIRFRSTTEAFDHQDGLAGQTPLEHYSGVRKLQLFRDASDPNPVTVFDFGSDFVEIGYNEGDDTAVYSVPASTLELGTYTLARTVHSHVRYRVTSTMHVAGFPLPGEFDCLQVLSDDTMLAGQLYDHGYYEYVFTSGAQSFPTSGSNAPLPLSAETGGFTAKFENGEWAYYYAVELVVTPDIADDIDVVLNVNMHESFRWQDEPLPLYQPGVFDTTPVDFEPVVKFGANSYWMTLE